MEKFTVDLDKVLDDFELQEDQEDVYNFQPNISKISSPQNTEINISCKTYPENDENILEPVEPSTDAVNLIISTCESQAINGTKDIPEQELPNDSFTASEPGEQTLNLIAVSLTQKEYPKEYEKDEGRITISKSAPLAPETDQLLESYELEQQDTSPPCQNLEENLMNQPALSELIQTNMLNSTNMSILTEAELEKYLIELEQEDFLPTSYDGSNVLQTPESFPTFDETSSTIVVDNSATKDHENLGQEDEASDVGLSFELPEVLEVESDDAQEPKLFDSPQMENHSDSSNSDSDDSETESADDDDVPNLIDDPTIACHAAILAEIDALDKQVSCEVLTSTECPRSDESLTAETSQGTTSSAELLSTISNTEEQCTSDAGSENSGERVNENNDSNQDIGSPIDDSIDSTALAEDVQGATALEFEPYTNLTEEERLLGILKPVWIPDEEASVCMNCSQRFTVIRRRHHCRACGKVLCSTCCSCRARLEYMEGKEARVCLPCLQVLKKVEAYKKWGKLDDSVDVNSGSDAASVPTASSPSLQLPQQASRVNPNNPAEYCSTIPPAVQAASAASLPIPTVMVPVGVLKKEGSSSTHTRTKSEPKQVIFSDGIRPGGDLTELDAWRAPPSENSVVTHRVSSRRSKPPPPVPSTSDQTTIVRKSRLVKISPEIPAVLNGPETLEQLKSTLADVSSNPVVFVLQPSQLGDGSSHHMLTVNVKLIQLDCCIRRTCWFFATSGMRWVAQDEIVILLEKDIESADSESLPPVDILYHLLSIYEDAKFKHHVIVNLGHTVTPGSFLGSTEHGGFLYFRTTFQCVQQLKLPSPPYLVGVLLQRWEIPWAKVFPLRLLLRLGAEFRYYPCPLFSVRKRKSVFGEVGHTIINLLADMRNYSYSLPAVTGLVVHMEEHETNVLLPKNRYHQLCKALAQSNDHVISLAASFSPQADAHLVCLQADDGSYQTQAINIHTRPRKVTGASFLVLNGALKSSSGLTGRSSIVEDGVMVQLLPDKLEALKQALIKMEDFAINCGKAANEQPEEIVTIKWIDLEPSVVNAGVSSPIDGRNLSGVSSIRVMQPRDYKGEGQRLLRWTELFILQMDDRQLSSVKADENSDITRFAEGVAKATCVALASKLAALDLYTLIGLRISSFGDSAEYQAGAEFKSLPTQCCEELDSSLIPILHQESSGSIMPCILELWFQIFHP